MTPRPAVNSSIFQIDLQRPRLEEIMMEQNFFNIVAKIKRKIVEDVEFQKNEGQYQSQAYSTVV
jgi:hypothetical protein